MTGLPDANEVILNAKGLKCPLPVLRARKAIRDVHDGSLLRVLTTDPSAVADFQAYCEATGHELVDWHENSGVFEFLIRPTA